MKKIGIVFSIIVLISVLYHSYEPIDARESVKTFVKITSSEANVRHRPSMDSDIVKKSRLGDKFEYLEPAGNWYKVLVRADTAYLHRNVAEVGEHVTSKTVIRRYDDSLQTRYGLIAGCFLFLIIGNTILHRKLGNKHVFKDQTNSTGNSTEEQIALGDSLLTEEKWLEAKKYYVSALLTNPGSEKCYFGIALCYYQLGMYDDSVANSKRGLEIAPNDVSGNFQLAITYFFSERTNDALKYFRKVLELDENHARSNYLLGINLEDDLLAITHLQKAINAGLEKNELIIAKRGLQTRYVLIGKNVFEEGDAEGALEYFMNALELESINDDKRIYEIAADSLAEHGFNDLASQFLSLAIEPYTRTLQLAKASSEDIFSKEYFKLLEEFSEQMFILSKSLSADQFLIEKIQDSLTESSIEDFVSYSIIFDLAQILKVITNGSPKADTLEAFGLSLISPKLFDQNAADLFGLGYEAVCSTYQSGNYRTYVESLLEISEKPNPLEVNINHSDGDEVDIIHKHSNILALPTALKIIDHPLFDQYATQLYRFSTIISKADGRITADEEENLKQIYQLTHHPIPEGVKNVTITETDRNVTLDQIVDELDNLVGLEDVKQEVKSLINFIRVQKEREKLGLKSSPVSYHCVFSGSPGTGKTTIARMIAKIYMHLGILEKGHLVETDRSGLIAEYTGQTAVKVNKTVNSALDGILFIDEAYALVGAGQDDYGREAVATLIKRMEDDRDRLIVILAGYTEEMDSFIESNPGFKSRFNRFIEFPDYSASEMEAIFKLQCSKLDYKLAEGAELRLSRLFDRAFQLRDKTFGNGRFVRNVFEKTLENQANRIAGLSKLTREVLTLIEEDDIVE